MTPRLARRLLPVWAISVLVLTLAPFGPWRAAPHGWATLSESRLGLFDLVANFSLFVPLGVLAVRAGAARWAAFGAGFLLSFAIEWTQQWIHLRHPSSFDVVANTLGALAGAYAAGPLLAWGRALWRPRLGWIAGGLGALVLTVAIPAPRELALVFPFAAAVLLALVGGAVWPRWAAFALAGAAVAALGGLDPAWAGAGVGGAALGALPWPACDTSAPR